MQNNKLNILQNILEDIAAIPSSTGAAIRSCLYAETKQILKALIICTTKLSYISLY